MAWLELDRRTGFFKVGFRVGERKLKKSLQTKSRLEAEAARGVVEQTLLAVERGWATVPKGVDLGQFLLSGGRVKESVALPTKATTLSALFDAYFKALPEGSLEPITVSTMRIHERQLYRILGKSLEVDRLSSSDLQRYVEARSKEKGRRGQKVTPETIKKAIITRRTVWNWGVRAERVSGKFPNHGLKFPKARDKPPFQTFSEIEAQVKRGGLAENEIAELWDSLFLTLSEIEEVLALAKENAKPWLFSMVATACHAGMRRSELLRSRLSDIDLESRVITVHEKKRNHERATTRRVPISPYLFEVLTAWTKLHPGGRFTFTQGDVRAPRSNKERSESLPITNDEAHDHLKRLLADTKFERLRGWHVFRHSFCSNAAATGVDQRIINAWVGHQTEDIVRRYRHLIPNQEQAAIAKVFGAA